MRTRVPRLGKIDYVNISVLAFGLAALSTSLGQIILPLRVLDVAPEGLKNTYLGILTFMGMGMAMLVQPVVGYLSDRTTLSWGRRRPYIFLGSLVATVLMVGIGAATNYLWLLVMSVLVQLFANVAQTPYDAMVKDQVPQNQRGQVSSIRSISGAAGAVLLVLATGLLMDRHMIGERDLWLWTALALPVVFMALTALWTMASVEDREAIPLSAEEEERAQRREKKTHGQMKVLLGAAFCFTLAGGILMSYTLYFLQDVVKLENPASGVGFLAISVGVTVIVVLYPAGLLSDKVGRRLPLYVSAGLGSVGSLLYLFAQNLTHVLLIGVLLGVAVGIFMAAGRALITDIVSERRAAQHMGFANFALIGGLAASKLAGPGVDYLNGLNDNLGYYVLLVLCAAAFCIGAVLVNVMDLGPDFER